MPDLSVIIPTVRPGKWEQIYNSIEASVHPYTYEVIFVGPYVKEIPPLPYIKTIVEYGCPSRCVQIASLIAKGRYMTWGSDDGYYEALALGECVNILDDRRKLTSYDEFGTFPYANEKDEVIVRYTEGFDNHPSLFEDGENNPHYRGPHPEAKLGYWHFHFHGDTRLEGIPLNMRNCPLGMLSVSRFKQLGGFDCRMQHINMCCHDLGIRLQKAGGELLVSPHFVLRCDFEPNNHVHSIYHNNDKPIFLGIYKTKESAAARPNRIEFNNYLEQEPVWSHRWEVSKK